MYPEENHARRNGLLIAILGIVSIVAVLIFLAFTLFRQSGKPKVDIVVVPKDAVVTINGKRAKGGVNRLDAGTYTFSASKSGFASTTDEVTVGDQGTTVTLILTPVSEEARRWAEANEELYLEAEGAAGRTTQEEGEDFRKEHPIVEHLPFSNLLFEINYRLAENADGKIILEVTADSEINKQYALSQIRNWGFNPDDFTIEYKDPGET